MVLLNFTAACEDVEIYPYSHVSSAPAHSHAQPYSRTHRLTLCGHITPDVTAHGWVPVTTHGTLMPSVEGSPLVPHGTALTKTSAHPRWTPDAGSGPNGTCSSYHPHCVDCATDFQQKILATTFFDLSKDRYLIQVFLFQKNKQYASNMTRLVVHR